MYENRYGRFTAIDPLLASGKSANPQTFNRYVYTSNNPISFVDPDGQIPVYFCRTCGTNGGIHWTTDQTYAGKEGYERYSDRPIVISGTAWGHNKERNYLITSTGIYSTFKRTTSSETIDSLIARQQTKRKVGNPMPINSPLLTDLGNKAPATQKFLALLALAGITGGLGAAPAAGAGGFIFGATVFGEAALAHQALHQTAEAEHGNLITAGVESDRQYGVDQAWKREAQLVRETGEGTRKWTPAEKQELLETGKVKGYEGHHINSVNAHPEMARDPDNVEFKTRSEHFDAHERNWRNPTKGPLRPR